MKKLIKFGIVCAPRGVGSGGSEGGRDFVIERERERERERDRERENDMERPRRQVILVLPDKNSYYY